MSRKRAIFILGVHRSGTSTVSNFITSLGYDLGHHPMAPREDNPKGFWENTEITRVNDEILALHGLRWDSLTLMRDLPIESVCNDKHIRSKVLQVVEEEFDTDNICIKDPRMCHLLPLWKSVLNEANYETHSVAVHRDPAAVAKSLAKRDMMSFERGLLLWLLYSVSLARYIENSSTIAVDYDELMKYPAGSLAPLKPLNPDEYEGQVARFVDDFLSDNLYHHSPTETTNPLALYALAVKQTLGKSEDSKSLKNITMQLDALLQVYSSKEINDNSASLYDELSTTKEHAAQLEVERQRYDDYVLDLSRQIDEQTEFSDSLKTELETLNQELAIRAEYVESLKNETLALNSNIDAQITYVRSMESSVTEMQAALKKKDEHTAEMQAALKKKDEYTNSLTQAMSELAHERDKLREAFLEKTSISDEYIQSLLATVEAKEVDLASIDTQLETARSVIKNLEVDCQSKDSSLAKISAALLEEKKHLERLEGSTLVRVSARIAGINRLTKTDE